MFNLPQVISGGVLFVDGSPVKAPVESMTLPQIKNQTVDAVGLAAGFKAPGMLEALTGIAITLQGVAPEVEKKFGNFETVGTYRIVSAYVQQGEGGAKAYEVEFRGIPMVDGRTLNTGQGNNHTYGFDSVEQCKITANDQAILDVNLKTGKAVVGSVDIYAGTTGALGI